MATGWVWPQKVPVRKGQFGGNTEYEKLWASLPGVDVEHWQTSIQRCDR